MTFQECVIRPFMAAMFNANYTVISKEDYEIIFTKYVDVSGIGLTMEYELLSNIHNLNCRIFSISGFISIINECLDNFQMPFGPAINDMKKYGHTLIWTGDIDNLKKQIKSIEVREKRFILEMDEQKKLLSNLKKDGVKPDSDARESFIRQLNSLGKFGFKIDKDITTVEELSLMIRDYREEITAIKSKKHQDA